MSEDNLCAICFKTPYKYKCPGCSIKTCSVECIKRHKKQTDCTGNVDETQFVPKKHLEEAPVHINRDYNFLLRLGRNILVGKEEIHLQAKNVFKRRSNANNNRYNSRNKRLQADTNDLRLQAVYKTFQNNVSTVIKRQNTMVVLVSDGMTRAVSNKTGYDKKLKSFSWTIEWVLLYDTYQKEVLSYKISESTILKDAVPLNVLNAVMDQEIDKDELQFYLKNVIRHKHNTYIELNRDDLVLNALKDTIVLEYPTIFVSLNKIQGNIIPLLEAYTLQGTEEESESNSDSSSSSSDSSDSDADETNSDDSSDSDGPPQETSSKQQDQ